MTNRFPISPSAVSYEHKRARGTNASSQCPQDHFPHGNTRSRQETEKLLLLTAPTPLCAIVKGQMEFSQLFVFFSVGCTLFSHWLAPIRAHPSAFSSVGRQGALIATLSAGSFVFIVSWLSKFRSSERASSADLTGCTRLASLREQRQSERHVTELFFFLKKKNKQKGSNWIMMKMLSVLWPLANKKVNRQTWPFGRASHFGRSIRISTATVVRETK